MKVFVLSYLKYVVGAHAASTLVGDKRCGTLSATLPGDFVHATILDAGHPCRGKPKGRNAYHLCHTHV